MKYQDHEESLSKCENIFLEAKRVLLNEQLDRIANMTLSRDMTIGNNILENKVYSTDKCYENLSSLNTEIIVPSKEVIKTFSGKGNNSINTANNLTPSKNMPINLMPSKAKILKKYFKKWKDIAQSKVGKYSDQEQTGKLNEFIANLKSHQHEPEPPPKSAATQCKQNVKNSKHLGCFKNRYKSQQNIIDMQRSKLEKQSKIINELELGIIREDLLKSIENTKINIKEIFSSCSEKVLMSKAPLLKAVEQREEMMIHSQKAPKMVQRMHQRAIERAKYREIILERKKLIEEARQKLLEEAIEKKKALEEEDRKRNLEIMNEQRKRELHLQKIRNEKKQEFEKKVFRANNFYKKLLMQQCFKTLFIHYFKSKESSLLATEYYLRKQKHWIFKTWFGHVEARYKIKNDIADAHFEYKALTKAFNKLKEHKLESTRSLQVAEDIFDFRLTSNTFIHWHRWVCKQIMLEGKKIQIAVKHNNRRLLFQYFYQWRSLPVVIQLEKAKEEKKRKWRQKVWEILPDYQPPEEV